MKIIQRFSNGCIAPGEEIDGKIITYPFIETGDFEKAKELLSPADYEMVQQLWTDELVKKRQNELFQQSQERISMFGFSS